MYANNLARLFSVISFATNRYRYFAVGQRHPVQSMMRARFLIREINGSRTPREVQCHARSIATPIEHGETNDLQNVRSVNDIPGPKALPVLGNWFRFIPYIGKSVYNAFIVTNNYSSSGVNTAIQAGLNVYNSSTRNSEIM